MKFLIHYSFTSSKGFTFNGVAKMKSKSEELARHYFCKQNKDCVINKVVEVSHG